MEDISKEEGVHLRRIRNKNVHKWICKDHEACFDTILQSKGKMIKCVCNKGECFLYVHADYLRKVFFAKH